MSQRNTPITEATGAVNMVNLQAHDAQKSPQSQAYCQSCKYFCDPQTTGKKRSLKYVRKFCYMNGETVTPKQRACNFYGEGAI